MHAAAKLRDEVMFRDAARAELAKLGATGPDRIGAVTRWLRGNFGDELAKPLVGMMVTADSVRAFEAMIAKFTSQGAGSFSPQHREREEGNGKIPGYDSMTFEQRRAAQDALAARR
jgi:hypothetical protein